MSDVLEVNQEKPVKILTEQQKEKIYGDTKKLIASLQCVKQFELYLYVYELIIKKLKRIEGYKDSGELLSAYEQEYTQFKTRGQEEIYENMLQLQSGVSKAEDIQWVLKEADRIPGYKNVDSVKKWCRDTMEEMEKKEKRKGIKRLILCVVLLAAVAVAGIKLYTMYIL